MARFVSLTARPSVSHGHAARLTLLKMLALLVLVAQFGLVAHRIEHYLVPDQMESGEDACAAFSPISGAISLPELIAPVLCVVFFLRFWTVRAATARNLAEGLGFRAHAPPF